MKWVVYSRRGCHLCEVLIEQLTEELRGHAEPEVRDIDTRPEWREAYDRRVPVVEVDGKWLSDFTLDRAQVRAVLASSE